MYVVIVAMIFYAAAACLLWRRAIGTASKATGDIVIQSLTAAAVGLHAAHLIARLYAHPVAGAPGELDLALGNVVSLVAWMTVALFLAASLWKPILNLGVIVMPWGLLGLGVGWFAPGDAFLLADLPSGIGRHIAIAIPAYGILSIAFAQALILWIQERQLRKPKPGKFFAGLPALETMESNLFQLTLLGFVLLTANLATGMLSARQHYGALLQFNHHILFALLAWGGFGALLAGRRLFGWRGRVAARWTMIAFTLLALAYFGTRFVSAVILSRPY